PGVFLVSDQNLREKILGKMAQDARIELVAAEDFITDVSTHDFQVVHRSDGLLLPGQVAVRNLRQQFLTPLTGVTYSIGYQDVLTHLCLLLLCGLRPWDSIVCISEPGRKAMEKLFLHVSEGISREIGRAVSYNGRLDTIPLGV